MDHNVQPVLLGNTLRFFGKSGLLLGRQYAAVVNYPGLIGVVPADEIFIAGRIPGRREGYALIEQCAYIAYPIVNAGEVLTVAQIFIEHVVKIVRVLLGVERAGSAGHAAPAAAVGGIHTDHKAEAVMLGAVAVAVEIVEIGGINAVRKAMSGNVGEYDYIRLILGSDLRDPLLKAPFLIIGEKIGVVNDPRRIGGSGGEYPRVHVLGIPIGHIVFVEPGQLGVSDRILIVIGVAVVAIGRNANPLRRFIYKRIYRGGVSPVLERVPDGEGKLVHRVVGEYLRAAPERLHDEGLMLGVHGKHYAVARFAVTQTVLVVNVIDVAGVLVAALMLIRIEDYNEIEAAL